jgi:hypothetical protein
MSSGEARVTAIAITRQALSVRRALGQPVHTVFRFESEDAVEKSEQSQLTLSGSPLPPALQVAARHPDMFLRL